MSAFMNVCMDVCMYVCKDVCVYSCLHSCMYVWMYVCMVPGLGEGLDVRRVQILESKARDGHGGFNTNLEFIKGKRL